MEEDQGRTSPPLQSKGSYNLDFDALDDSFNPFQSKKTLQQSPPLGRKDISSNAEVVPEEQPPVDKVPDKSSVEPASEKPATDKPAGKKPATDKQAGEKPATDKPAGEKPATDKPASEKPATDKPAGEKPATDKPASEKPAPDKPASEKPATDKVQDDGNLLKEPSEKPKRKKSKSPSTKRASTGSDVADGQAADSPQPSANASEDTPVAEKPVKTKKVVKKPKSRPSSKNLEGQGTPVKPQAPEGSEPSTTQVPTNDCESAAPHENKAPPSQPQEATSTGTEDPPKPPADSTQPAPDKPSQEAEVEKTTEGTPEKSAPPSETTPAPADKTASQSEQTPPKAVAGEEAVDSPPKKERSSGKVKKSKTKVKKSPRSSALDTGSEVDSAATGDHEKESKSSPRVTSQGDSAGPHDTGAEPDAHKSKHPAARVLEQQIIENTHSQAKGDSDMADSRTESVVKLVQVLKYSQSDWNKLKQELELGFQAQLLAKEREWSGKLADRDARISTLEDTSKKLRQTNEDMRTVMAEFEKTIGQLQSEKEKTTNASQQSLQDVIKERDQALEDLQSVETAFSDLHRRYEKTKGVVEGFKQNEEMLKKCVQDLQNKLKKAEAKLQSVKEQAEEKLERATEEIEKTQKSTASDIARLEAALRKSDLQIQGLESSLEQKVKENKELAAICDELIAKVQ